MSEKTTDLNWKDGQIPVSVRFDDPYFSLQDGLAETRHVFLAGNDLPARFRDGFHIAELGFGTGLNLLTAVASFRNAGRHGKLQYTSFEAFPLQNDDIARALKPFPQLDLELLNVFDGRKISTDDLEFELVIGDARDTLPTWTGVADAWFLDGFSPAKNPELWEDDLLREVAGHSAPGGTFATYTAAGHVRRGLEAAGFEVERRPGFGRKRHMTRGQLK